jgi:hypothetical protein
MFERIKKPLQIVSFFWLILLGGAIQDCMGAGCLCLCQTDPSGKARIEKAVVLGDCKSNCGNRGGRVVPFLTTCPDSF